MFKFFVGIFGFKYLKDVTFKDFKIILSVNIKYQILNLKKPLKSRFLINKSSLKIQKN